MNKELSYITFKGLAITDINLVGNDAWGEGLRIGAGCSNIIIENCEFYNLTSEGGADIESGIQAIYLCGDMGDSLKPISNCVIRNNYIHNCTTGWSEAMMLEGNVTDCEIYNNTLNDTGNIGIDVAGNFSWTGTVGDINNQARNITISKNLVMNCNSPYATSGGIYVDGGRDVIIEHNIIYHSQCGIELGAEEPGATVENFYIRDNLIVDCGRSLGVGGYQSTSATHRNTFVYNNTFVGGTWYKEKTMVSIENTDNFKMYNNIFYAQSGNSLIYNEAGINLDFNYNCWYHPSSSLPSLEGSKSFKSDPLFVLNNGTLEGDYTLQNNSPCLNVGLYNNLYCSNLDLKGKSRVNNVIDVGCYEK